MKSVAPKAEEKAYRGWPIRIRTERGLVAIMGFADHVNVNMGKGARLKDPKHFLEGTGKSVRHVKVRTVADARSPDLRKFIEQLSRICMASPIALIRSRARAYSCACPIVLR